MARRKRKAWGRRVGLWTVRWFGAPLARLCIGTSRAQIEGWDRVEAIEAEGRAVIFALWHNRLLSPMWFFRHRGIHVLVSRHHDGALIAALIERLGFVAVRGSAERRPSRRKGGVRALHGLAKHVRGGKHVAFTPDGPAGPIYSIAPGLSALAKLSGCEVVPVGAETSRHWTLRSWDLFRVPKPFCRGAIVFGEPIRLSGERGIDRDVIERAMAEVSQQAAELIGTSDPYSDAASAPTSRRRSRMESPPRTAR